MSGFEDRNVYDDTGSIRFVNTLSETVYHIGIDCPGIAACCYPGQFVMVKVDGGYDPLLRRPFSIFRAGEGIIEIVYKVVGQGTRILSEKGAGSEVGVLGPLGNTFSIREGYEKYVLVNGGIGFPPLSFMAGILRERNKDVVFYYGAGTGDDIFFAPEFEGVCGRFVEVTEDGSSGRKGLVTDAFLDDAASGLIAKDSAVVSCGPLPMLREMSRVCERYGLSLEVSLENEMACGMGICQGCAVKVKNKDDFDYKLVCRDGPVFDAGALLWDK